MGKNPPANAGDARDVGSIPRSGRGQEEALEEEMATHSSILAWESHGLRSLAGYSPCVERVGRNLATKPSPNK